MAKPRNITAVKKAGSSPKKARGKKAVASTPTGKGVDDIFGFLAGKGKVEITGDIVSPAFTREEWGSLYPSPRPRGPRR
jgi:hypothetical protein